MFLELLEGPFWKTWNEAPKGGKAISIPTFPTVIHATEEERAEMRGAARRRWKDCDKSLADARSVNDILSAPIPKDADGHVVSDVCLLGLTKRPPDDAASLLETLPLERWCQRCTGAASTLLVMVGERAAAPLVRIIAHHEEDPFDILRCVESPLAFPMLLQSALDPDRHDERATARAHMHRFPNGTARLALAIAAGADPAAAGVQQAVGDTSGDPAMHPAIRAGMLLSVLARLGREDAVLDAARELGLEDVAKRWIAMPTILPSYDARKLQAPQTLVLEGKRLNAPQRANLFRLLARIDWLLAERDVPRLRDALDAKSRKRIADLLARRWKRRTNEAWAALAAIALQPERAPELANVDAVAHRSKSHLQRSVERTAVEVIAKTAVVIPEHRDAMLRLLGSLALDPVKVRRHTSATADDALIVVANALGLPAETLDDRTIPSLGLDANASMTLDWGGRPVEVRMTPALEIVFVIDGEKRSSQPSPRKGDDKRKVARAKKIVEELRTEGRVLALGLGPRVTRWMKDQQRWGMDDFRKNVLGHPILRAIARGFVWGTFDDGAFGGKLTSTFRVAEDGTFADENDNALEPRGARVGMLHVGEIEPDLARRWGSVMADYELLPLVPQLSDLRTLTPEQAASDSVELPVEHYARGTPPKWIYARSFEANSAWERVVGRHRITALYFYQRKVLAGRVRRVEDYEDRWLKWGEVDPVVVHEMFVDLDEIRANRR